MTDWISHALDRLEAAAHYGYGATGPSSSEPAALVALALMAHGRAQAAQSALEWLDRAQHKNGCVGVWQTDPLPSWPTALALLAWQRSTQREEIDPALAGTRRQRIARGLAALLAVRGEQGQHASALVGHDGRLVAWPWVAGTHSWIEPTALAVLALKALGQTEHARTREAIQLLLDRQLPSGGCNYGNTSVLGQVLRAHPQPTGLALTALAGEPNNPRIQNALHYARGVLEQVTSAVSASWLVLGLSAHGSAPPQIVRHLERCYAAGPAQQWSPYAAALLLLARRGAEGLLVRAKAKSTNGASEEGTAIYQASCTATQG